ncbi:hypothetical protein Pmar_PMAR019498 [Perkinsus marinus ATCC 50983]|uniref:Uncharacterized protein n=1 Tax=Perkinsus marinus (strain ATCC 50983 / TXsc) TaxID=423536 RepID=C5KR70_PERM5|nr:hypothetical protein Pmar_PMAR019498 [Perkinsus marinus ATCC 50983]EER12971.1 hypothetical protein Pmar_PMAR019498 [Perkinsus marinus ATCC 50983]|eukprot:XP_002781176.1 hypothetical protein Pmar_PMAR019498 [Perkinsus marinus ATCC 50983]
MAKGPAAGQGSSQQSTKVEEPLVIIPLRALEGLVKKRRLSEVGGRDQFFNHVYPLVWQGPAEEGWESTAAAKKIRRVEVPYAALPESVVRRGDGYYCQLCNAKLFDVWAHVQGSK